VSGWLILVSLLAALAAGALVHGGIAAAIGWLKERALAKPNPRSSHTSPTPQGGGIVVAPVALVVCGAALAVSGSPWPGGLVHVLVVGAAALALTFVGFIDDMRGLGVGSRLAAQILAVAFVVVLVPADMRVLPPVVPQLLERLLLIGALLWFVNLFNFMDGIDLISAVETATITLGIALLAGLGLVPAAYGVVALALLGAVTGFGVWNAPPARLFLGDAGSLPIGLVLGVLLVHVAASGAPAAALILPLYYLADATITLVRRLARGERVWEAHRQHFYQEATRQGFSVAEIVVRIGGLGAVLIVLAVLSTIDGAAWAAGSLVMAAVAVALTLRAFARPRR
jgi:UDP-N-acetylmuramyl pentapeptide phosphotransferase/UDP-N-acetylglucosamine-1-phosphate transferase